MIHAERSQIMKFTKNEKIWLALTVFFFVMYNMPFLPAYNHPKATLIHALLTLVPLWITVYIGLFKVSSSYKEKKKDRKENPKC